MHVGTYLKKNKRHTFKCSANMCVAIDQIYMNFDDLNSVQL